jgi:hypothetical protein
MILTASGRAGSGNDCWRTIHCRRLAHLDHEVATRQKPRWRFSSAPAEEPEQAGKEHDQAAHRRRRGGPGPGVGRSGVYRLTAATQWESIKIGRSQHVSVGLAPI